MTMTVFRMMATASNKPATPAPVVASAGANGLAEGANGPGSERAPLDVARGQV